MPQYDTEPHSPKQEKGDLSTYFEDAGCHVGVPSRPHLLDELRVGLCDLPFHPQGVVSVDLGLVLIPEEVVGQRRGVAQALQENAIWAHGARGLWKAHRRHAHQALTGHEGQRRRSDALSRVSERLTQEATASQKPTLAAHLAARLPGTWSWRRSRSLAKKCLRNELPEGKSCAPQVPDTQLIF